MIWVGAEPTPTAFISYKVMDKDAKSYEEFYRNNPFWIHRGYWEYNETILDTFEEKWKSDTKPTKKKKTAPPAFSITTQSSDETM